jgi:hypothetical protein
LREIVKEVREAKENNFEWKEMPRRPPDCPFLLALKC